MFKCTGICSDCAKCKSWNLTNEADARKTRMISFPKDFAPDINCGYGVAFDIGTTTIVGMLWDLSMGRIKQIKAETNPQNQYGMDVISRITFSMEEEGNLNTLRQVLIRCLSRIIGELTKQENISTSQIVRAAIGGNTTMSHIIAGYSPSSLAFAPFHPAYTGVLELSSEQLPLDINVEGKIIVLPGIAGHVGGDIAGGLVASRFFDKKELSLFIDIGTNGEIVLFDGNRAVACSTAAGPAFEGAAIQQGMRAADGAIERVEITDDEVFFSTIGSCRPVGICGSGLIDAISEMLKEKLINKTGRLLSPQDAVDKGINWDLAQRLRNVSGKNEFVLVYMESGKDITITQKDIREIQLATAAVKAGIHLMLDATGKSAEDISHITVAGAFGSYIDKHSAQNIGLLPRVGSEKISSVGNAAGAGVSMALVSQKEFEKIKQISETVEHLELASCHDFQNVYLSAMSLG